MKKPLFRREPTGTSADDWHALPFALAGLVLVVFVWLLVGG